MIHIVIGTKAQLIKMAPVMAALEQNSVPYRFIWTGQHRDTTQDILDNFALRRPDHVLYDGPDITSIAAMARWSIRILWQCLKDQSTVFDRTGPGLVLVHGDTFSTLLGALMARLAGLQVGHVESGLRSFKLFHPFPEELTRLLTFQLTNVYFCPDKIALQNVSRYRGDKVETGGNTLLDALRCALAVSAPLDLDVPQSAYAIVTLHRFENFSTHKATLRIVEIVERIAESMSLLFILHKPTENALRRFGLFARLAESPYIEMRQRYDYFRFVRLLQPAEFVVSDGGSNQEECSYLGKPILLLRKATERAEGVGRNCVLSEYRDDLIDGFVRGYAGLRADSELAGRHPSQVIANYCKTHSANVVQ